MKRLAMLTCLLLLLASYAHAQTEERPTIAWIMDGELWLAGENLAPFQYTTGAFCCALFSPQGTRLAYQHTADNGLVTLVIFNTAPPQETVMIATPNDFHPDSLLQYVTWRNEDQLLLTTFDRQNNQVRWDLWHIDLTTGQVVEVKATNQGGRPYPQPDGDHIAIINPGIYEQQTAFIEILDATFQTIARYEYSPVSLATDFMGDAIPSLKWMEEAVRFVIPPPMLIYETHDVTESEILELNTTGTISELGAVQMNLGVNAPQWSPDGNEFTYTRYSPDTLTQANLYVWNIEQAQGLVIREQKPYSRVIDWKDQLLLVEGDVFIRLLTLVLWSRDGVSEYVDVRDVAVTPSGYIVFLQKKSDTKADIMLLKNGQLYLIGENLTPESYLTLAQY